MTTKDFNTATGVREAMGRVAPKVYSKAPSSTTFPVRNFVNERLGSFPVRNLVRDGMFSVANNPYVERLLPYAGAQAAGTAKFVKENPYLAASLVGDAMLANMLLNHEGGSADRPWEYNDVARFDGDIMNRIFPEGRAYKPNTFPFNDTLITLGGRNAGADFYTGYQEPEAHQMTLETVSVSRAEEEAMQEAAQKAMAENIGGRLPQGLSRAAAEEQLQAILGPSLYGQMMTKGIPVDPNNEYVAQLDENGQPFYLAENM